jgi:hypothetical protein
MPVGDVSKTTYFRGGLGWGIADLGGYIRALVKSARPPCVAYPADRGRRSAFDSVFDTPSLAVVPFGRSREKSNNNNATCAPVLERIFLWPCDRFS